MRALVFLLAAAAPMAARWIRLETPHFNLLSDASERSARLMLDRLDLARRVFGRPNPLPVRVFVLTEPMFRPLRPAETTRGFYQSGAQRDSIVLPSSGSPRVAAHEYVHMVLHHSAGPLPKWLEEGLCEFYSTVEVRDGKAILGRPVEEHLRTLRSAPWLTAQEMAAITADSEAYRDGWKIGVFYAQSWALVHMLRLSDAYRGGFQTFLTQLERGESQASAFQQAFGKTFSETVSGLKDYLDRPRLPGGESPVEIEPAVAGVRSAAAPPLDADLAYAELARECGRPAEADRFYARLARQSPTGPLAETALGYLALSREQFREARGHFEKVMAAGHRDPSVAFELAMLVRDHGEGRAAALPWLERAVEWNPDFAEAHFLLGVEAAQQDRHEEAVRRIQRAASIFPRQSYFWHALSLSHRALGDIGAARAAARRALDSAAAPDQAEMASTLLAALNRPAESPGFTAAAPPTPAVVVPESWRPQPGENRLEGILERIDCLGSNARFFIRSTSGAMALWVESPGEVLMKNLSSVTFEFRCGPQKPTPVKVEYRAQPDPRRMTAGVLTSVEFPSEPR